MTFVSFKIDEIVEDVFTGEALGRIDTNRLFEDFLGVDGLFEFELFVSVTSTRLLAEEIELVVDVEHTPVKDGADDLHGEETTFVEDEDETIVGIFVMVMLIGVVGVTGCLCAATARENEAVVTEGMATVIGTEVQGDSRLDTTLPRDGLDLLTTAELSPFEHIFGLAWDVD